MSEVKLTIFTPTYNRAYILNKCYESLLTQTNKSFKWLIVDDGSSDNTEEIVNGWMGEKLIDIEYYKQENGGKQRAHNYGVELCTTELFMCVDSDDHLTETAVDELLNAWEQIEDKTKVSGIVANKGYDINSPIGKFPDVEYSTLLDLYRKHKHQGDTALMYRTDLLKKYPYDVADGEKFIGENYAYNKIDQNHHLLVLPKIVYLCEYLEDGLTHNVRKLTKNNPIGYMVLNNQNVAFSVTPREKFINTMKYIIGCKLSRRNPFKGVNFKMYVALAYFPAMLYYHRHYKKV